MKLKIVMQKGTDGYLVARCPSLPGCWSQGKSRPEALANIREAIALYLEPDPKDVRPGPRKSVVELTV